MFIHALTQLGLHVAIETEKEIVQIFNRNFTKTFFMPKEDYLSSVADKEGSFYNFKIGSGACVKDFDNSAFMAFKESLFVDYGERDRSRFIPSLIGEYVGRMYEGIEFMSSEDEIISEFYKDEKVVSAEKKISFQPEHFLVGTQVTVSPIIAQMYRDHAYPSVFTVEGIRQNGPDSYVLTTTQDDMSGIVPGERYHFNISHVEQIVFQGKGVIKIHPWKEIDVNEILKFADASKCNPEYAKKNHWLTYGDSSRLVLAIAGMPNIPRGAVLNTAGLMRLLLEQSFVQKIQMGRGNWDFARYSINKKRAKRFVKQNLNRFLSSAKKAQKEYDDEM